MSKSTAKSVEPREDVDQVVGRFVQNLQRQETSAKTREAYRLDLLHFADWLARTVGEAFGPEAVTREYRGHLISVEKRQPAQGHTGPSRSESNSKSFTFGGAVGDLRIVG